jgi:hypothetical protein
MEHRSRRTQAGRSPGVTRRTLRLGVIADTHGLYDPAVEPHFASVSEILHAGDIGGKDVIQCLRRSLRYQETLMAMKEAGGHAVSCFDVEA